ncbi:MAG: ABC transporter substrate-binding protein [Armatimonadetes bacterium]|nr:ABC transporter substrate-binding protein [Armatimonadota bacterium]
MTRILFLSTLVALCALIAGCARPAANPGKAGGNPARLKTPHRIVSLTPSNTEILYALGLEDRIAGVTGQCTYPPEAKKKPKVGDVKMSLERIVALEPDLVLAHGFLNDSVVRRLKALGIPVMASDPKTFEEVYSDIENIGRATGRTERAEEIVSSMKRTVALIKERKKAQKPPCVLVVVQSSPLWTAGPRTFVQEMLIYAGGENVAGDSKPGFNPFPAEVAISRNPDILVVTRKEDKSFFERNSLWRKTRAVREGRIYLIDPALLFRPGPRLAEGLVQLDRALFPKQ